MSLEQQYGIALQIKDAVARKAPKQLRTRPNTKQVRYVTCLELVVEARCRLHKCEALGPNSEQLQAMTTLYYLN